MEGDQPQMAKNIFLTGTKGSGKSTILREILFPYRQLLGGYYVQRVTDPHSGRLAFRILDISTDPYYLLNVSETHVPQPNTHVPQSNTHVSQTNNLIPQSNTQIPQPETPIPHHYPGDIIAVTAWENSSAQTTPRKKGLTVFPDALERRGVEILKAARNKKIILMDELGRFELLAPRFSETVFTVLQNSLPVIGVLKKERNPFIDQISLRYARQILDLDCLTPEYIKEQLTLFLETAATSLT